MTEIRATRFVLVDDQDRELAVLEPRGDGAVLKLYNAGGASAVVEINSNYEDGSVITRRASDPNTAASLCSEYGVTLMGQLCDSAMSHV